MRLLRPPGVHAYLIVFVLLIGTYAVVGSQEADEEGGRAEHRFVMRSGVAYQGDEGAYEKVVSDSIDVVLRRNGFADSTEEEVGVYVWEYTILSLVPRLHLSLSVIDRDRGVLITTVTERARANLTLYNSVDELIGRALEDVRRYNETLEEYPGWVSPIQVAGSIPIPEPPESDQTIVIQPVAPLGAPGERLIFAEEVTVPGEISGDEAYTQEFTFTPNGAIAGPDAPARRSDGFPQPEPYRRVGVQLHYGYARIIGGGFGIRYSLLPDRVFAAQETDIHVTPAAIPGSTNLTHLEGRVMAGATLFGSPSTLFSLEGSTGIGGAITFASGGLVPPYYDWYWNVANLAIVMQTGRQRWFVRSGFNYGFETERGFFVDGLNGNNFNPQLYIGTIRSW